MKVFWNTKEKKELTKAQAKAFSWVIKILKKPKKECDDLEKEIQKIYTNIIIF